MVLLAGLQAIPRSLYEASEVEGATGWENFWLITLPMVSRDPDQHRLHNRRLFHIHIQSNRENIRQRRSGRRIQYWFGDVAVVLRCDWRDPVIVRDFSRLILPRVRARRD